MTQRDKLMSNEKEEIASFYGMKKGDIFTMQGRYKRRTFMQWLRGEQKQLQRYVLMDNFTATPGGLTRYEPANQ